MDNFDSVFKLFSDNISQDPNKLNNILNIIQNVSSNNQANQDENKSGQVPPIDMPDMETIMMITKLLGSMKVSKDDPRANLLYALKPYLEDSKKDKIDQYVKFLGIANVISLFNKEGDASNGSIFGK